MLRPLYNRVMALAAHRRANWALAVVSFIESSVFPIPPDVMLIPMVLAQRHKALLITTICTLASVLGGLLGYFIGLFLFESIGKPILDFYSYGENFDAFQSRYNEWGVWIVLIAGLTPFPYKVITIASGVTGLSLPVFILASIIARGARFSIVAALLWKFGEPIQMFIERYLGILFTLFIVMLIGGFVVVNLVL